MAVARTLFRTEGIELGISSCGATDSRPSAEELDTRFTVIIPVAGTFVRHVDVEELVASPAVALLVEAGQVSRTSHPRGGHDRSLYMSLSSELVAWFTTSLDVFRRRVPLDPSVSLVVRLAASRAGRGERLSSLDLEEVAATLASTRPDPGRSRRAASAVRHAEEIGRGAEASPRRGR